MNFVTLYASFGQDNLETAFSAKTKNYLKMNKREFCERLFVVFVVAFCNEGNKSEKKK